MTEGGCLEQAELDGCKLFSFVKLSLVVAWDDDTTFRDCTCNQHADRSEEAICR